VQWLREVAAGQLVDLPQGIRVALASLVELYAAFSEQLKSLDKTIGELAKSSQYAKAFGKLKLISGVGTLTAMIFLTEIGNLNRLANRRPLGAYLGLAPAAFESGDPGAPGSDEIVFPPGTTG
jgi:transposase